LSKDRSVRLMKELSTSILLMLLKDGLSYFRLIR
jgi:hypothetical protein